MSKEQIEALEAEIAALPAGYISRKNINGKTRLYYQWTENGKKRSEYLDDEIAGKMKTLIEKRRELQQQLRTARALRPKGMPARKAAKAVHAFRTSVSMGNALHRFVTPVAEYRRRDGLIRWKIICIRRRMEKSLFCTGSEEPERPR